MEERLGLQVVPIPFELPPVPIYMIWRRTRRHDTAQLAARSCGGELGRFGNSEQHDRQNRDVPGIRRSRRSRSLYASARDRTVPPECPRERSGTGVIEPSP
jgi:hypothetical protein